MSLHSLQSNSENYHQSTTVNSLEDIKNFLASQNIKKTIIEKIAVSFMAKIPTGTVVKIVDNMLHIGESIMKLGEDIYLSAEKTQALMEKTQNRAIKILDQNLPMIQPERPIAIQPDRNIVSA